MTRMIVLAAFFFLPLSSFAKSHHQDPVKNHHNHAVCHEDGGCCDSCGCDCENECSCDCCGEDCSCACDACSNGGCANCDCDCCDEEGCEGGCEDGRAVLN